LRDSPAWTAAAGGAGTAAAGGAAAGALAVAVHEQAEWQLLHSTYERLLRQAKPQIQHVPC
jgi:hypothetical protein